MRLAMLDDLQGLEDALVLWIQLFRLLSWDVARKASRNVDL